MKSFLINHRKDILNEDVQSGNLVNLESRLLIQWTERGQ